MTYKKSEYIDRTKQARQGAYALLGLTVLVGAGQYKLHTEAVRVEVVKPVEAHTETSEFIEADNTEEIKLTLEDIEAIADRAEIEIKIIKGLEEYGNGSELPITKHIPAFVEATERYPIFKKYPYLLPAISILESSGGVYVTRANNPLNWAARVQKAGLYYPASWEESIEDAITAIGGDKNRGSKGTSRQRQAEYYQAFRDSEDLRDFVETWEPANPVYYQNLIEKIELFERQ